MSAAGDPEDPEVMVSIPLPLGDDNEDPAAIINSIRASVASRSRRNECTNRKATAALFVACAALGLSVIALLGEMNSFLRARLDFAHLEQLALTTFNNRRDLIDVKVAMDLLANVSTSLPDPVPPAHQPELQRNKRNVAVRCPQRHVVFIFVVARLAIFKINDVASIDDLRELLKAVEYSGARQTTPLASSVPTTPATTTTAAAATSTTSASKPPTLLSVVLELIEGFRQVRCEILGYVFSAHYWSYDFQGMNFMSPVRG